MLPDEGKVQMVRMCRQAALNQHAIAQRVKLFIDVLHWHFDRIIQAESRINDLYMEMAKRALIFRGPDGETGASGPFGKS